MGMAMVSYKGTQIEHAVALLREVIRILLNVGIFHPHM